MTNKIQTMFVTHLTEPEQKENDFPFSIFSDKTKLFPMTKSNEDSIVLAECEFVQNIIIF